MTPNRFQHLSDAFNSIISMMLAAIRARGLRGLLDLPNMVMTAIYLRRLARDFTALIASLKDLDLSALPSAPPAQPVAPAPSAKAAASPRARAPRPAQVRARRAARPASAAPAPTAHPTFHPVARIQSPQTPTPYARIVATHGARTR